MNFPAQQTCRYITKIAVPGFARLVPMLQFVSQWALFFGAGRSPAITAVEVKTLLYAATNTDSPAHLISSA